MLHKIFKDSNLTSDDLFNLRTVCKDLSAYATEALFEQRFRNGIQLDVASVDFACLASIYSSRLRPYIKSVHFTHLRESPRLNRIMCPNYSSIRTVKFEAHIEELYSARALKKVLQQTNHLETFILNLEKLNDASCWCSRDWTYRIVRDRKPVTIEKDEERGKVDMILSGIKSDRLAELVITGSFISYKTLKSLLERHRGAIRKMTLRGCQVTGGTWIELLQWVSHDLTNLDHLELYRLQEMKRQRTFDIYDRSGMLCNNSVTITGKKDIDAYIASLGQGDASD